MPYITVGKKSGSGLLSADWSFGNGMPQYLTGKLA